MSSLPFACPYCLVSVEKDADRRLCPTCGRAYSQTMDILQFCGPGVTATPAETDLVKHLCGIYDTATFPELALARVATRPTTDERRQRFAKNGLTTREGDQRFYQMYQTKSAECWPPPYRGFALDLGFGLGAGLVGMAHHFEHVVGVDVSVAALIVAKKILEAEGVSNSALVQAAAQNPPFLDKVFHYAVAINVLEHVLVPKAMLSKAYRVFDGNGIFCGDSRNRFGLFYAGPHVGLRWVGLLPRPWMASYVRWGKGVSFNHICLLSFGDLRRSLKAVFGREWRVAIPDVSVYRIPTVVKRIVDRVNQIGPLQPALVRLSPAHLVWARRVS